MRSFDFPWPSDELIYLYIHTLMSFSWRNGSSFYVRNPCHKLMIGELLCCGVSTIQFLHSLFRFVYVIYIFAMPSGKTFLTLDFLL